MAESLELWQRLGHASYRDWVLAAEKARRVAKAANKATAKATALVQPSPTSALQPVRTAERVARLENELERARSAAIVRDDALRVVLAWLANELPGCWTWVPRGYKNNPLRFPHIGSLRRCNRCGLQWLQVWTPNRLRRYEGAAHAERCSRPATWQLTTTKAPDGELSTWLVTVLVHALPCFVLGLYIAICVCAVCGLWRVC